LSQQPNTAIVPWRYRPAPAIPESLRATDRQRAFLVGAAAVEPFEAHWGHNADTFSPEVYGDYAATSDLIYAASSIRAKNIGKLNPQLWREGRGGKQIEVTNARPGSAYELLRRVNPFWTFRRLVRLIEWSRCLWGSGYVVLNRGANGRQPPSEMWWVRPDRMRVVPDATNYIGGYIYEHMGMRIPFAADEVLWFPMDNPIDEFSGLSPLASARLSVDTSNAAARANRNIFVNGLMAGGLIAPAEKDVQWTVNDVALITEAIGRRAKGDANAHRWVIMGQQLKLQEASFSPEEMQYLEQLRWSVSVVARVYGVPAGILQDREHSTYNNLTSDHLFLWNETLLPEASDIADVFTEFLLPMFPGEADRMTFDSSMIPALQADQAALTAQAQTWWQMGVPLNDLIAEYNPNLPGGYEWGNVGYQNYTLMPPGTPSILLPKVDDPIDETALETSEPARAALALIRQLRDGANRGIGYGSTEHELRWRRATRVMDRGERAFLRELRRLFTRQQESVLARLRRKRGVVNYLTDRVLVSPYLIGSEEYDQWLANELKRDADDVLASPFDIAQWDQTFVQSMLPILEEIVADAGGETLADLGIVGDFDLTNPAIRQWLEDAAFTFAHEVNSTTIEALRTILQDGIDAGMSIPELADAIKAEFGDISASRAETIARTETAEAVNQGGLEAARQSGVVSGKVWLAGLDNRTRESHIEAHGQEVGLEEDFAVGDATGPCPGSMGRPEEDINCRCTMTWILKD